MWKKIGIGAMGLLGVVATGCSATATESDALTTTQDGSIAVVEKTLTYTGYDPSTMACGKTQHLLVFEPAAPGKYPVMIYTVGTLGIYDADEGRLVASEMAKRGFIAASAEYATADLQNDLASCSTLDAKTACIYGHRSTSAVNVLCNLANADCSRGVVAGGMSQGAAIAAFAQNYDPDVRAAWVMGFGGNASCWRELPQDRLRIVDGTEQKQIDLEGATGCYAFGHHCFRANGSGWYMVQDSELESGQSAHCYYVAPWPNGGALQWCNNYPPNGFDPGWAPPSTLPWSLDTNLDWLASFTN